MTSGFGGIEEDEDDDLEWGVGAYPAVAPQEPDGERLTRIAQAKQDGIRIWEAVKKELTRGR